MIAWHLDGHSIRPKYHCVARSYLCGRADGGCIGDTRRAVRCVTDERIVVFDGVGLTGKGSQEDISRASRVILASRHSKEGVKASRVKKSCGCSEEGIAGARLIVPSGNLSKEGVTAAALIKEACLVSEEGVGIARCIRLTGTSVCKNVTTPRNAQNWKGADAVHCGGVDIVR